MVSGKDIDRTGAVQIPKAESSGDTEVTISDLEMQGRAGSMSTAETPLRSLAKAAPEEAQPVIVLQDTPPELPMPSQALKTEERLKTNDDQSPISLITPDQQGACDGKQQSVPSLIAPEARQPNVSAHLSAEHESPTPEGFEVTAAAESPGSIYGSPLTSPFQQDQEANADVEQAAFSPGPSSNSLRGSNTADSTARNQLSLPLCNDTAAHTGYCILQNGIKELVILQRSNVNILKRIAPKHVPTKDVIPIFYRLSPTSLSMEFFPLESASVLCLMRGLIDAKVLCATQKTSGLIKEPLCSPQQSHLHQEGDTGLQGFGQDSDKFGKLPLQASPDKRVRAETLEPSHTGRYQACQKLQQQAVAFFPNTRAWFI